MTGFVSCDPNSNTVFARRDFWSADKLSSAVDRSAAAARCWASRPIIERCAIVAQLGEALLSNKEMFALSIRQEMGKLFSEALDEVERAAKWCQFLAVHAPTWLAVQRNDTGDILRMARGVILAVTPWNYPVWQLFRPLAAALVAGNALLLKPATNVAQTSSLVESLCRDVLPDDLVQCLWVDELGTRAALAHPAVSMLVCTASEATGRQLGSHAGHHLKPAVLELGGNNAFIVLEDADIDSAAKAAALSRCLNAGQACTAAKRFIVHQAVSESFREQLIREMAKYRCGTNLAPLARADLCRRLVLQVNISLKYGAELLLGGSPLAGEGNDFPATVLSQVTKGMPAFDEELFGPVAAICVVQNDTEAIHVANAARQQLVASIWSRDKHRAAPLAATLRVGMICFNTRPCSRFELPFEGNLTSGFGSTMGREGLLAFTRPVALLG